MVLEYHVISGAAAKSTDLTNMEALLPLLTGHSLGVHIHPDGTIRIVGENNAVTVTTANVLCTNGVVHIVNAVIVPNVSPTPTPAPYPPTMTVVETAMAQSGLLSLVGALVSADLVDALSGDGPMTVFAPTNDAFDAISSVVAGLTKEQLQQVLEYHVISGVTAKSTDLTNMEFLAPLFSGHSLGVNLEEGKVRIVGETNAVTVTTADVLCTNGVVHIVNAVLIPNLALAATAEVASTCQEEGTEVSSHNEGLSKCCSNKSRTNRRCRDGVCEDHRYCCFYCPGDMEVV